MFHQLIDFDFFLSENIFKPNQPKSKRKLDLNAAQPKVEERKPLVSNTMNNRAELNFKQREERRKMMYKTKGGVRRKSIKIENRVQIKGVRTNRRFDLMMENRLKMVN